MQHLTVELEKNASEMPSKVLTPAFSTACPGKDLLLDGTQQFLAEEHAVFGSDETNLEHCSTLFVPGENIVSYLSSGILQAAIPLNLSTPTKNDE